MSDNWTTENTTRVTKIGTPQGDYTPVSDVLAHELKEAAKYAGLRNFKVFLDGNMEVSRPSDLPTTSIAALNVPIRIEPYDKVA